MIKVKTLSKGNISSSRSFIIKLGTIVFLTFIFLVLSIQNANAYFTNCGGGTTYTFNGVNVEWDVNAHWWTDVAAKTNAGSFPLENDKAVILAADNDIEATWINSPTGSGLNNTDFLLNIGCIEINSGRFKPDKEVNLVLAVKGDIINHVFDGMKYGVNSACNPANQGGAVGTFDNSNCYISNTTIASNGPDANATDSNVLRLNGTTAQTLETGDPVENLEIANTSSVTLTKAFTIFNALYFTGTGSTLYIDADLTIDADDDWYGQKIIIPNGFTVEIRNGAKLTASYGLTIQNGGVLKIHPGSKLVIGNGNTDLPGNQNGPNVDIGRQILQVDSGGTLQLAGASGNVASIESRGLILADQTDWTFSMNGILNAKYFKLSGMSVAGVNVGATGIVQKFEYGEVHNVQTNGVSMTIGNGSSIPSAMYSVGFYKTVGATGVKNISANATWCAGNTTYLDQWVGDEGGDAFDIDGQDANAAATTSDGCITWGAKAGTKLLINNVTEAKFPEQPEIDTRGAIEDYTEKPFFTLAFSLNQNSTATNITSIKLTQIGTIPNSDIGAIKLYRDGGSNCTIDATAFGGGNGTNAYNAGDIDAAESAAAGATSTLIGIGTLAGTPGTITFTVPTVNTPGTSFNTINLSNTNQECVHVVVDMNADAKDGSTVQFEVSGTTDVANTTGATSYNFSDISGPPVSGQFTNIRGGRMNVWEGNDDHLWSDTTNNNGNWKRGVPSIAEHCFIGSAANICTLDQAVGDCLDLEFTTNGSFDMNGNTKNINVNGSFVIGTGYNFSPVNGANPGSAYFGTYPTLASISMVGAVGQTVNMGTVLPGHFIVTNTSALEPVTVIADSEIIGDVTINSGTLKVQSGAILTVNGNLFVRTGGKLLIENGATLKMANGRTITVDLGGTISIIGNTSLNAKITAKAYATGSYNIIVNGTIQAKYYTLENLGTTGIVINNGATILSNEHLQNGNFLHPLNNNTVLLSLDKNIPFNSLTNMTFDTVGSGVTLNTITAVKTLGTAAAGTLTIDSYSGDLSGASFGDDSSVPSSYLISWLGAANTLDIIQDSIGPTTVDPGLTYNMGRFSFQQNLAGASYNDTDITSLKLKLIGTGSSNDIGSIKAYYDSACTNSGVLIGTRTYSGSPATITFSFNPGDATIPADASSTVKKCIYITYDVSASAVPNNTIGVELSLASDIVNSQTYAVSGSTPAPINLGTAATISNTSSTASWVGTTSTVWNLASNWSPQAIPTKDLDCIIDSGANNPTISTIGNCRNITVGNGALTIAAGATLNVYGSYDNSQTGSVTQIGSGQIVFNDDTTSTAQTINSSDVLKSISFAKTVGGGSVSLSSNVTITDLLTIPVSSNFEFQIPNSQTLTLSAGLTLVAGTFNINSGGILDMGTGASLSVQSGSIFKMIGNSTTNAKVTSTAGFYNVVIDGEIWAQYYTFDKLANAGVLINSGATINPTYHLQDCTFSSPESDSTVLLKLNKAVPSNSMANCSFNSGTSTAVTLATNIDTSFFSTASGPLNLTTWSGDLAGDINDNHSVPGYDIGWTGAVNDIDIVASTFTPSTPTAAGAEVEIAQYKFNQAQAGSYYIDALISSIKLTMIGTAVSSDISSFKLYYDSDPACGSALGTAIASGTPSGSPGSFTFSSFTGGGFTIAKHATAPPVSCLRVTAVIAAGAIDSNTVGVKLQQASHFSNNQGYPVSNTTTFPIVNLTSGSVDATSTITGSVVKTWTGTNSGIATDAGNWSGGLPSSTSNCVIANVANQPTSGAFTCNTMTIDSGASIGDGTTSYTNANVTIHGDLINNGGSFIFAGTSTIDMTGTAAQSITSSAQIPSLTVSKTGGASSTLTIGGTAVSIDTLTLNNTAYVFNIPNGKELKVYTSTTVPASATLSIEGGGLLSLGSNTILSVAGTLKMIGTSGNNATMGSVSAGSYYSVSVSGTINADYYTFDHLQLTGLTATSTSIITALTNGEFLAPTNNTTFFTLQKTTGFTTLDNVKFDLNGSGSTGCVSVNTTAGPATLTINSFLGDLSGTGTESSGANTVVWSGAVNTIVIAQNSTSPVSVNANSTVNMGRFSFKQKQAGASFSNIDVTSLKITLVGTATSTDVSAVKLYYDPGCNGSGTLISTGTLAGNPATKTFSIANSDYTTGDFIVEAHATTPPTRCINVHYTYSASAVDGRTAGVKINASSDFVNDLTYAVDGTVSFPVTLGASSTIVGASITSWTGGNSINWADDLNWDSGAPTSTKDCNISSIGSFQPTISAGTTATCKTLTNTNGTITFGSGTSQLHIYGSLIDTGTINFATSGILKFFGTGGATQNLKTSSTIGALTFSQSGTNGKVELTGTTVTANAFTMPAGLSSTFEFSIPSGKTLSLAGGATLDSGIFTIGSGGIVKIGDNQTFTTQGTTIFKITGISNSISGISDPNKGKMMYTTTRNTWNFVSAGTSTLSLTGFLFDGISVAGLQVTGGSKITILEGGQFINLSSTYASVKVLNFSSTAAMGTITANWIGFDWGPLNTPQAPASASYKLTASAGSGCGAGTINFKDYFGDFQTAAATPDPQADGLETEVGCTFNWTEDTSAPSPVSISSFSATAYNGAVSIDWMTSYERDHLGFNVYRANADGTIFQQINSVLIRNINTPGSFKGKYNFTDNDVVNGVAYYYYIEDIDVNGVDKVLHGPKTATPLAALATAPTPGVDSNNGSNNTGSAPTAQTGLILNPSYKDLGNGAVILSQTTQSIRIKLTNPIPTNLFKASINNSGYVEVDQSVIPGYTKTTKVSYPELIERTLLIEVHQGTNSAELTGTPVIDSQVLSGHRITPAPSWQKNASGVLTPAYNQDAAAYAINSYLPNSFYTINSTPITVGTKKFIKVVISPLEYNAVTWDVNYLNSLVLAIGLNGSAWSISDPVSPDFNIFHPTLVSNNLRIKVKGDGVFKVTYQNMLDGFVDGPFDNTNTNLWRAYYQGEEISLEISSSGNFTNGDSIRFYLPKGNYLEDQYQEVILSTENLLDSFDAPLRIQSINADPTGVVASSTNSYMESILFEQNNNVFDRIPLEESADHYFWKFLYAPAINYGDDFLEIPIEMPYLDFTNDVTIKIRLWGEEDVTGDILHDVGLVVNNHFISAQMFLTGGIRELTFTMSANKFFAGSNTIKIQSLGTYTSSGLYDYMYIDSVKVDYYKSFNTNTNLSTLNDIEPNSVVSVDGFTNSAISIFDITNYKNINKLTNSIVTNNSGIYSFDFDSGDLALNNKVLLFKDGSESAPVQLSLTNGYYNSLKESTNGADYIIIGNSVLLQAVTDLVARREMQGMRVQTVNIQQIYDEFSHGQVSSKAIKDFLTFARTYWQAPAPQYLLLLGNSSYDPNDFEGNSVPFTFAMPFLKGIVQDFGGDNWYVEEQNSIIPQMAVGRLPSENAQDILHYVSKVLDYEDGKSAPYNNGKSIVYIADNGNSNINFFKERNEQIANIGSLKQSNFQNSFINRNSFASNLTANSAVLNAFDSNPFLINYYGHGAEDIWTSGDLFTEAQASTLTNSELPIVVTWDCLNTYIFEPDGIQTIGESLIFNQNSGSIAFFGSSTMTTPPAQMKLANSFFEELGKVTSKPYKVVRIGEIAQKAKVALGDDPYTKDIVRSFMLFGDPTLKLPVGVFTESQSVAITPVENEGAGGCSAFAGDSKNASSHGAGLLEILAMLFAYVFIRRSLKLFSK